MYKKISIISILMLSVFLTACDNSQRGELEVKSWDMEDYEKLEDIISIEEITEDGSTEAVTYNIRYKSDDCEVVSFLSIPQICLQEKVAYPCIIYNRGGNREYGANRPEDIAYLAETSEKIIFASQYRGVSGGTGVEEFGGNDLHDVLKLIDFCDVFSFVDMDQLYMMGVSRGGMMTYMAAKEDTRIKKIVVISGVADAFMNWDEREDMQKVYMDLVKKTPKEAPEEYENRSATYWADEINCPILIIHSKLDKKVSYAQAEKMEKSLQMAGKEYEFVSYEDDVHGLHPEDFAIIMNWFRKE